MTRVHHADGVSDTEVYLVNIKLPNNVTVHSVRVTKAKLTGMQVLIGMDVITCGDFALTNLNGKTVFSFRIPSLASIDYVAEAQKTRARGKVTTTGGFSGGNHKRRKGRR